MSDGKGKKCLHCGQKFTREGYAFCSEMCHSTHNAEIDEVNRINRENQGKSKTTTINTPIMVIVDANDSDELTVSKEVAKAIAAMDMDFHSQPLDILFSETSKARSLFIPHTATIFCDVNHGGTIHTDTEVTLQFNECSYIGENLRVSYLLSDPNSGKEIGI